MSEWKEYKLGEILQSKGYIRGPFGSALKRDELLDDGIPVYEQQHAIYNKRVFRFFINEAKYEEMKRFAVQTDDIIISCSGTVGEVSIIKEDDPKGIISQALLLLRVNTALILPKFLLFFLKSKYGHNAIISCSSGSVQINIAKRDVVENIPILLPSKAEQNRIVSILDSIDDKIDLLHRENATLEQMAETLFRQWFVEEAKEEWEEGKLGDICNYVTEKIDIGNVETGDYISTENMCSNKQGVVQASSVPGNGKATKFRIDDVLLSNIRPYFKKIWLVDREGGCSADVLCIRSKNELFAFFSYYTIRQDEFFDYVMLGSKGCKMPRGDKSHIMNWPIIIPPKDELSKFNEIAKQGITKIRNNQKQIQTLIQTRDGLLPRLMSGEVKV